MSNLRPLSRRIEKRTGADSVATIEEHYRHTPWDDETGSYKDAGTYACVWPHCEYIDLEPEAMWLHVHGSHGAPLEPADLTAVLDIMGDFA